MNGAVLTIGEALGVLRTPDSLSMNSTLDVGVGGAELNVAIGLARLDVPSTWLGRVGSDGLGRRIIRELRAEAVTALASVVDTPTGLLLKERDSLGRTVITYHRTGSAGSTLAPSDLDTVRWSEYSLLHLTGITPALSESARATVQLALQKAREAGLTITFDVNFRSRLWSADAASASCRAIAQDSDIVFAGPDEAQLLLDRRRKVDTIENLATAVAQLGVPEVVIKNGADGALALYDGNVHVRRAELVPVADTVGAGDAFVAGYLSEVVRDSPIDRRLTTGVIAGAAACRHMGDWEGSIRRADLENTSTDPVVR